MKKIFLVSVLSAFASVVAMADVLTFDCANRPDQFSGSVGSNTVSCPALGALPAGATLTGVTLLYVADYTFGSGASNDIKLTFTAGAPAGVTWALSSTSIDVTGGFNSSGTTPGLPVLNAATAGVLASNFASAFNVGVGSSVVSGGAGTSSAGVQVQYTYTNAAPEPATLSLIGLSLVGLGYAARRRSS